MPRPIDTDHAKELVPPAVVKLSNGEARLERLLIDGKVEIRLSWWKEENQFVRAPLELSEADLMKLLAKGIRQGVLLPGDPN